MIKILMAVITLIAVICVLRIPERNRLFEKVMSCSLIFTFIINTIVLYVTDGGISGVLSMGLPLFHCSLGMMIHIYYLYMDKEPDIFLRNANVVAMIGSVSAIFFSGTADTNIPAYLVCALSHTFYLMISAYNVWIRNIRMKKNEYVISLVFVFIWNIIMFIYNIIFHTNYSFVNNNPFSFYMPSVIVLLANTMLFAIAYLIDYIFLSESNNI